MVDMCHTTKNRFSSSYLRLVSALFGLRYYFGIVSLILTIFLVIFFSLLFLFISFINISKPKYLCPICGELRRKKSKTQFNVIAVKNGSMHPLLKIAQTYHMINSWLLQILTINQLGIVLYAYFLNYQIKI